MKRIEEKQEIKGNHLINPYREGELAGLCGANPSNNPYRGTAYEYEWLEGYSDAITEEQYNINY